MSRKSDNGDTTINGTETVWRKFQTVTKRKELYGSNSVCVCVCVRFRVLSKKMHHVIMVKCHYAALPSKRKRRLCVYVREYGAFMTCDNGVVVVVVVVQGVRKITLLSKSRWLCIM